MASRRPAYRKKRYNRLSMILILACLTLLIVVIGYSSVNLKRKQTTYALKEASLRAQIEEQQERTQELAEYEKYTKTDAFVEEVAKKKLGLVYEGEIVFRSN